MKPLNDEQQCFVCRRRADGLGIGQGRQIGWMCQICCDTGLGKKAYAMSNTDFDAYERAALVLAGNAAGTYLDRIGQTDLAALHPDEWMEFCRRLVTGFGEAIREQVRLAPPTHGGR